jgi:hypothetical protein
MSSEIDLYVGRDFALCLQVPLAHIVKPSLQRMLGIDLTLASVALQLLEFRDDAPLQGAPVVHNLVPDFGYAYVTVILGGRMVYRHPHTIGDLITQPLQAALRSAYPNESFFAFRIVSPITERRLVRPTPDVEGQMMVTPYGPGEAPTFEIKRVETPVPDSARLASFGIAPRSEERRAMVKVLVPATLHADLHDRGLSNEVEEGGFLVGRIYRDEDCEGAFVAHLAQAPPAEQTGASLLHFTFTGDSFTAVKRTLFGAQRSLLGWYHTHLFPATEEMGLSSIDLRLHFSTFTLPWQLAGLINIDDGRRTLRFYVRQDDRMVLCPHWVVDGIEVA